MKTKFLGILGAVALLLSAGSAFAFEQRPIKYSGTFGCSFANNTNLSFAVSGVTDVTGTTCTGQTPSESTTIKRLEPTYQAQQ